MTIELVTGTPGAGKTCYVVAKRIIEESGRQVAVEREGGGVDLVERRIIVAGINGLSIPHERLPHTLTGEKVSPSEIDKWNGYDEEGEPVYKRLPGAPMPLTVPTGRMVKRQGDEPRWEPDGGVMAVEASLFNWWLWCKPGDLIVCDEVQFVIPRGTLGKVPPHYVKSLEIHRHYGVDFIFITQSPTLLDSTIRALVGLHRHIRSVMGSPFCLLYLWDHASNTERITGASKSWYWRFKSFFKLYKSTVAVVAPPTAGRKGALAVPILLALALGVGWKFSQRFAPPVPVASAHAGTLPAMTSRAAAQLRPAGYTDVPKLAGCYTHGDVCKCFDASTWRPVKVAPPMCRQSASSYDGLVAWEPRPLPASGPAYGAAAPAASAIPVGALPSI